MSPGYIGVAVVNRQRTPRTEDLAKMFDLTFLGTSASVPSAERNHPGLLVEAGSHRIMVDCGDPTRSRATSGRSAPPEPASAPWSRSPACDRRGGAPQASPP